MNDNQNRIKAAIVIALTLAIPAEGLRQYAYDDTGGILTICYGHTGKDVVKGKKYTIEECKALLDQDMEKAIAIVEECVPGLPVEVLAAFGDVTYNEGRTAACDTKNSHAARYLKAGMVKEACAELPKWNKARVKGVLVALPGLTKRRNQEVAVCIGEN